MTIFKLPDLGEGLPDAEIHEWYVKDGDEVKTDQPLVSMETAKAVVDVPCPQDGTITKLYGQPGDIIKTGDPLVAFQASESAREDKGTVVGNLEESTEITEDTFTVGASNKKSIRIRTTPAVRLLAKKLGVDLQAIQGSGEHGIITRTDVEAHANKQQAVPEGYEPLRGVRRAMLASMNQSHQEVVAVSIYDEADIQAWQPDTDITVRIIEAIIDACRKEPALNAWYSSEHAARKCFDDVHLGLAIDSDEGLFVPVIKRANKCTAKALREQVNHYKQAVKDRSVPPEQLKGATITLSNFGKFAGRFASPIIVPPQVAILGVGRHYDAPVVVNGGIEAHRLLPLSLTFDHRAVTGGEATRFLGAVMASLEKE